jgi:PncC family amidohydrolase
MFKGGVVAYSNEVKTTVLGVDHELLLEHGAVCAETVAAMSCGVQKLMESDVAISTSGIAGPSGGSLLKPVGLVHFSVSRESGEECFNEIFQGDRETVQIHSVIFILSRLVDFLVKKDTK